MQEPEINALWVGGELSRLELLTLKSFAAFGHPIRLWHYDPIPTSLPLGTMLRDANDIIPRSAVFTRKHADPKLGIGLNSFATFSDIFRYRLLHLHGGWWVDMDVTCLRRIDFDQAYFFRDHHRLPLVGNVMAVPRGCPVLKRTYDEVRRKADENTLDWMLTNEVLSHNVAEAGLVHAIRKGIVNSDQAVVVDPLLGGQKEIDPSWYFVHWCNERLRTSGFAKNAPPRGGELEKLMVRFGV